MVASPQDREREFYKAAKAATETMTPKELAQAAVRTWETMQEILPDMERNDYIFEHLYRVSKAYLEMADMNKNLVPVLKAIVDASMVFSEKVSEARKKLQ